MSSCLVSDWFYLMQMEDLVNLLHEGDLLEFRRKRYSHWAVYIGYREIDEDLQPCIIHRIMPTDWNSWIQIGSKGATASAPILLAVDPTAGPVGAATTVAKAATSAVSTAAKEFNEKCSVQLSSLDTVIGKDMVRINNSMDGTWMPFPAEEIVARAEKGLECSKKYNVINRNCEHFAKECRYGRKQSLQVQSTALALPIAIATANPWSIPVAAVSCAAVIAFNWAKPFLNKRLKKASFH